MKSSTVSFTPGIVIFDDFAEKTTEESWVDGPTVKSPAFFSLPSGVWSEWTRWSECDADCGLPGNRYRSAECPTQRCDSWMRPHERISKKKEFEDCMDRCPGDAGSFIRPTAPSERRTIDPFFDYDENHPTDSSAMDNVEVNFDDSMSYSDLPVSDDYSDS